MQITADSFEHASKMNKLLTIMKFSIVVLEVSACKIMPFDEHNEKIKPETSIIYYWITKPVFYLFKLDVFGFIIFYLLRFYSSVML